METDERAIATYLACLLACDSSKFATPNVLNAGSEREFSKGRVVQLTAHAQARKPALDSNPAMELVMSRPEKDIGCVV